MVPADGVHAESHARHIGVHHDLDQHRRGCRRPVESMFTSIGEHALAESRAPDIGDAGRNILERHEEIALQLAGEGMLRGILFVGRDADYARRVMERIVNEVSAESYLGEEDLQQKKLQFVWGTSQYDGQTGATLDGFISNVLLDTRPDMT